MPISSGWPLQKGAIRFFVPHFVAHHLAQHPLSRELYIQGVGFYPQARHHSMTRTEHEDNLLLYCSGGHGEVQALGQRFAVTKADLVLHHDDPPCEARLKEGYCPECRLRPDMQSTCLWPYCPSCKIPLRKLRCPGCGQDFENPCR